MTDTVPRTDLLFASLTAVVQYRRKGMPHAWRTMAAYDVLSMAEKYAAECTADGDRPWEYRAAEIRR